MGWIFAVNRLSVNQPQYEKMLGLISTERRNQINSLRFVDDRINSLLGELLIRHTLSCQYQIKNENICFDRDIYGKPFVVDRDDFHFNVSHSNHWVVCGVSHLPIGIDIEYVDKSNTDIDIQIANRFFSQEEVQYLLSHPPEKQSKVFYELWTKKESCIKAVGKGLALPLRSFSVLSNTILIDNKSYHNSTQITKKYPFSLSTYPYAPPERYWYDDGRLRG
ncbi:4'-phosphopantetheinyl transferase family protein [Fervidibacillus albus]|uniref:4'-phosphopantetheinyl transferase superfamily protein n=1 Tax=Fervidibacillus albus TaxID=2980026 RepID=A0A9E8LUF6_9BACI|nr:4'-phosphopantetheinyl transferase superfamily protein [Fervidibacillus albus]WAA09865.1 4'-phosphopantetheinyl transferase superfamily protein [Fervidibacillus albus]